MKEEIRENDQVVIMLTEEQLGSGSTPFSSAWLGARGKVVGFSKTYLGRTNNGGHRPGAYLNLDSAIVQFAGNKMTIPTENLTLADFHQRARRQSASQWVPEGFNMQYLHELPGTPVWEGDIVQPVVDSQDWFEGLPVRFVVLQIQYHHFDSNPVDLTRASVRAAFDIGPMAGMMDLAVCNLRLVERGRVWKHYRREPNDFKTIQEEAGFLTLVGEMKFIDNPNHPKGEWTVKEIPDAMAAGLVHAPSVRPNGVPAAIRFLDEDFGKKYAEYALAMLPGAKA